MITLCELLHIAKEDFKDYKVHFAIGRDIRKEPYNTFLIDGFQNWQEHQTQKNFGRKYVLSLIYYDKDIWMFGGIYQVLPVAPVPVENASGWKGWRYQTELIDACTDLIGRAFFRFKKEFRASFDQVRYLCLPHYREFLLAGKRVLDKEGYSDLVRGANEKINDYLESLKDDVSLFCKKFDYRFESLPWGESKNSVERSLKFLRGEDTVK